MIDKKRLGEAIKQARLESGMSAVELCSRTNIAKSSLSEWEHGKISPSIDAVYKICEVLNINLSDLLEPIMTSDKAPLSNNASNNITQIKKIKIPILGSIACGEPIFAEEEFESFASISDSIHADFALWAKGDSMIEARICDGDLVFIKRQETVENGEIAVILIEDEATLKRVYYDEKNATLTLMAANSKYAPFVYHGEQLNNIKILGKAVAFQSIVK